MAGINIITRNILGKGEGLRREGVLGCQLTSDDMTETFLAPFGTFAAIY